MKTWTIAYQYNTLTFEDATPNHRNVDMDDSDLKACFDKLVQQSPAATTSEDKVSQNGTHIRVCCRQGLRRVVNYCMSNFIYIRAAGGVVKEPDGQLLIIFRNQRWDLPKGGVEIGETLKQAALREVMEETAMHDLVVGNLLTKTYHIYDLYGGWHLKQTSWYSMTLPHPYPITTQQEEGITLGEWMNKDIFRQRLLHSYATMRAVADKIM